MFKDGRTNVHDEKRSGQQSIVSDDLVKVLNKKFVKDDASQFQKFCVNLSKFHILFSMILSQARLSQVLCKMGFKMLMGVH
jgi:hypothetical protein